MASFLASLSVALISFTMVFAAFPRFSINKVCKKNNSKFDACTQNCLKAIRPLLRGGIPELRIPSLEPLKLGDFVVQFDAGIIKFQGRDFTVRGGSNFEFVNPLKVYQSNNSLQVVGKIRFPKITLESEYNITGNLLNLNFHGKGPVTVVTENMNGNVTFKGKIVKKGGQNAEFVLTDTIDLKLKWNNYETKLGRGFFKDPAITEVFNAAINKNQNDIIDLIRPRVESIVKEVVFSIGLFRLVPKIVDFCL